MATPGEEAFVDTVASGPWLDAKPSSDETLAAEDSLAPAPDVTSSGTLTRGARLGRYLLINKLGAGAMGVVYAAYDPKLDRKVALKLLKSHGSALAQARLEREAQALAKLAHPHVVGVYDVDVHGEQLYVAMEFIAGQTLGTWIETSGGGPRPWPEVLRVFRDAGRGLAAAHAAGLIHRDFKPDNVMLGADGRARVMDFGLARPEADTPTSASAGGMASADSSRLLSKPMTHTGAVMGTPAYMAPEQFEGKADAHSDQFSYCVALYEGLYGRRPFTTESFGALIHAISSGTLEPVESRGVPAWLRAVILRGLAADPEQRWASMEALLDALADDPAQRRRRWAAAAAGLAILVGGAATLAWVGHDEVEVCTGFEYHLDRIWDAPRKTELRAAFESTSLPYAVDTWTRVEAQLDDYARGWVTARGEACAASQRGEQSGELLDRRMRCLDERLHHLEATVDIFAEADVDVLNRATQAVAGLPSLARCADLDALMAEQPGPEDPALAEQVSGLDEQLIEAEALRRAGRYGPGLEVAKAVVTEAEALDYAPLRVRAGVEQGVMQDMTGAYEEAVASLERAYEDALALRMTGEAADASKHLVWVLGHQLERHDEAAQWARPARGHARALGTPTALSAYHNTMGAVANKAGKYDDAHDHFAKALASAEAELGSEHADLASLLTNLGVVAHRRGRHDEARAYQRRALAIKERTLGSQHPSLVTSLNTLGVAALDQGELDEARIHLERAAAVAEAAVGPSHQLTAISIGNLGLLAKREGRLADARAYMERTLAITKEIFGAEHPSVGIALVNLGEIAIQTRAFADAREYARRSLEIFEARLGPEHLHVAYPLTTLGEALIELSEADEALVHLERAVAIRSAGESDRLELAKTRLLLARALWSGSVAAGGDRARARELAALAGEAFAAAGEVGAEGLAMVRDWQADHPAR